MPHLIRKQPRGCHKLCWVIITVVEHRAATVLHTSSSAQGKPALLISSRLGHLKGHEAPRASLGSQGRKSGLKPIKYIFVIIFAVIQYRLIYTPQSKGCKHTYFPFFILFSNFMNNRVYCMLQVYYTGPGQSGFPKSYHRLATGTPQEYHLPQSFALSERGLVCLVQPREILGQSTLLLKTPRLTHL